METESSGWIFDSLCERIPHMAAMSYPPRNEKLFSESFEAVYRCCQFRMDASCDRVEVFVPLADIFAYPRRKNHRNCETLEKESYFPKKKLVFDVRSILLKVHRYLHFGRKGRALRTVYKDFRKNSYGVELQICRGPHQYKEDLRCSNDSGVRHPDRVFAVEMQDKP